MLVFHLLGGLRALHAECLPLRIEPGSEQGGSLDVQSQSPLPVIPKLRELGLSVIGVRSLSNRWELDGIIPGEWRTFHTGSTRRWLSFEGRQKWFEIAHAATKQRLGKLWDMAARISYQIEACTCRFEETSDRYAGQLRSLVTRGSFKSGRRFEDLLTQRVFLSIQSFLVDACVLRDFLAEFAAAYVYNEEAVRITTLSTLIKRVLKDQSRQDATSIKLRNATAEDGWLTLLGHYRDLVVHSAPLALAKKRLWVRCEVRRLPDGRTLPCVRFPLPIDPRQILRTRSGGDLYEGFSRLVEEFLGPTENDAASKDALEYVHEVFGNLGMLALELMSFSPVPPEIPILTDDDLAGPINWMKQP